MEMEMDQVILTTILCDLGLAVSQNFERKGGNVPYRDPFKALRILVEEVGEVADALSPATIIGTKPPRHELDSELIDTAVAVITWMYTRRK